MGSWPGPAQPVASCCATAHCHATAAAEPPSGQETRGEEGREEGDLHVMLINMRFMYDLIASVHLGTISVTFRMLLLSNEVPKIHTGNDSPSLI